MDVIWKKIRKKKKKIVKKKKKKKQKHIKKNLLASGIRHKASVMEHKVYL